MVQRPQMEDADPTHDEFQRCTTRTSPISPRLAISSTRIYTTAGVVSLGRKIALEPKVFYTLAISCCEAEWDISQIGALAKDLGCQHDDKENGKLVSFGVYPSLSPKSLRFVFAVSSRAA